MKSHNQLKTNELEGNRISAEALEQILRTCERDLLGMALLEPQGQELDNLNFRSAIFRYVWLKLTKSLRDQANFYSKGIGY